MQEAEMPLTQAVLPGMGNTYLDSTFLPMVQSFIREAATRGVTLNFNEAFRPPGAQAEMQANPNAITPAAAGSSLHEAGFAVDVNYSSLRNIPGGLTGDQQRTAIREAATAAGLSWGGNFQRRDPPHFYFDPGGNRQQLVRAAQEEYRQLTAPASTPVPTTPPTPQPNQLHPSHVPHHRRAFPTPAPHPTPVPNRNNSVVVPGRR
ncbi:M15 family metallopeptidase [Micromonospora sp. STR1s_5]|nr:M15 family metallopeptidase [Micromonospora sp. STR1s_5]